jgi:hypothetical protein
MKKEITMKIMDLNGFEIEVTDLDTAIQQADWFKDAHHLPPVPSDWLQQRYWRDMHEKLVKLKSDSNGNQ